MILLAVFTRDQVRTPFSFPLLSATAAQARLAREKQANDRRTREKMEGKRATSGSIPRSFRRQATRESKHERAREDETMAGRAGITSWLFPFDARWVSICAEPVHSHGSASGRCGTFFASPPKLRTEWAPRVLYGKQETKCALKGEGGGGASMQV